MRDGLDSKELFVRSEVSVGNVTIECRGTIVSKTETDKREAASARGAGSRNTFIECVE